ncbi:Copper amine oxidase N-terminal domain-containing protein [Paenibacillus sp. OV219]|nr:Copper amine oxidase N-terminal domain-containing protein [Paenibacillus sp. OV219]
MKKKLFIATLMLVVSVSSASIGAYAATKYSLSLNGKKTSLDVQIIKGDAYVSAKKFGELLGQKVTIDTKKSTVTVVTSNPAKPALKAGEYQAKDFIFSDVQASEGVIGWEVTAEVKALKAFKGAVFTITFLDANGKRVGSAAGSVSDIAKNEVRTVQFITTDDLTGWKKLRPQVDMSY